MSLLPPFECGVDGNGNTVTSQLASWHQGAFSFSPRHADKVVTLELHPSSGVGVSVYMTKEQALQLARDIHDTATRAGQPL